MADFTLVVGAEAEASFTELQSQITQLFEKCNKPLEIKVKASDSSAVDNLQKQLKEINSSNKSSSGSSYLEGVITGAKSASAGVDELIRKTTKYAEGAKNASTVTSTYKNEMTGVSTTIKAVADAQGQMKEVSTQVTQSFQTSAQAATQGATAYKQYETTLNSITTKMKSLYDEGGGTSKAYDTLSQEMEKLNSLYDMYLATDDYSSFSSGLTTLQGELVGAKSAADAFISSQKEAASVAQTSAQAAQKYGTTLDKLQKALIDYSAAKTSLNASSREEYANISNTLTVLKASFEAYKNGTMAPEQFAVAVEAANTSLIKSTDIIKTNGDAVKSTFSSIKGIISKITSLFSTAQIFSKAYQAMKQMVSTAIEIDSAMTQIKIVTGATDSQMTQFLTSATSLAKDLGQTITDVASSIETFSRLGYDITDSTELAKYANILANVADTDTDTATTGLTSIIKGYNMDVSDAEHVSDVLVKVGQEYAISAEELMAAFERGGAALYASGTDFEKSAALFAATNASLQNAETTGTLWKTVSARIRGATTELEEMGEETDGLADGLSKYREEIIALSGVDIMEDEDTYKDMYDIFVELAEAWDGMKSDEARSRVAEILGGTRNLSGIMSTITNIKDAIGAYESAMNSAGTAAQANDIYLDSIEGHIGVLKATFEELSTDVVNSDFAKGVVDFGTTALNVIDSMVESIGTLSTALIALGALKIIKNFGSSNEFALHGCESMAA